MTAPDDTIVAFPALHQTCLRWQALSLCNAARAAAEALSLSHDLAEQLGRCADETHRQAEAMATTMADLHTDEQAARCRALSRELAAL